MKQINIILIWSIFGCFILRQIIGLWLQAIVTGEDFFNLLISPEKTYERVFKVYRSDSQDANTGIIKVYNAFLYLMLILFVIYFVFRFFIYSEPPPHVKYLRE